LEPQKARAANDPDEFCCVSSIDAGAKLAVAPNAWVFASFDGEFSSRSQSYAGKAGAKVSW
jgi:uncharacterized protein with beta-barrel porin domain